MIDFELNFGAHSIKIDFSTVLESDLIRRVDTREHHFERHVTNNIVESLVRGPLHQDNGSIQSYKLNHLTSICQSNANQGPFYPGQANSTAFASHSLRRARAKSISLDSNRVWYLLIFHPARLTARKHTLLSTLICYINMLYHAQPIKFRNFRLCVISNRATPVAGNNHRGILERVRVSDTSVMMRCVYRPSVESR